MRAETLSGFKWQRILLGCLMFGALMGVRQESDQVWLRTAIACVAGATSGATLCWGFRIGGDRAGRLIPRSLVILLALGWALLLVAAPEGWTDWLVLLPAMVVLPMMMLPYFAFGRPSGFARDSATWKAIGSLAVYAFALGIREAAWSILWLRSVAAVVATAVLVAAIAVLARNIKRLEAESGEDGDMMSPRHRSNT